MTTGKTTNLKLRFCFKLQPTQSGKHSIRHSSVWTQPPPMGHRRVTPNHGACKRASVLNHTAL